MAHSSPAPKASTNDVDDAGAETPGACPRRGGRPSRDEAEQLGERILDAATELFFTIGYGGTSIDAVARRARISKRTFYHRYADKPALFAAVVHRTIGRLRPPANVPLIVGADTAEILRHLAEIILHAALEPSALALHRLLVAESARFPELAAAIAGEGGTNEAIALIAGVLERATRAGEFAVDNPTFAAQQFLQMIIAAPQRRSLSPGAPLGPDERKAWARDVVALFVNGCRGARG